MPRVLSIQSHVVSGYVGNKSATFPLQLRGIDVDPLNTVMFSNHKGYARFAGWLMDAPTVAAIWQAMKDNNLHLEYRTILSGFCGTEDVLQQLPAMIDDVRRACAAQHPLVFICDPVLGDGGRLYVPESLIQVYRQAILPHATIITPNQSEVQWLTGQRIDSERDAAKVAEEVHSLGPTIVIITSLDKFHQPQPQPESPQMTLVASHKYLSETVLVDFPKIPGRSFVGCGDLFTALIAAEFTVDGGNREQLLGPSVSVDSLTAVLIRALAGMHAVLQRTADLGKSEMALVASMSDLLAPRVDEFRQRCTVRMILRRPEAFVADMQQCSASHQHSMQA